MSRARPLQNLDERRRNRRSAELEHLEKVKDLTPSQSTLLARLRALESTDPIISDEHTLRRYLGLN